MSLLAALLIAAQAAPAEAGDRAVLDAFRAVCDRVDDLEAMRAEAVRGGWTSIEDADDPRIARINQMGRESAADMARVEIGTYRAELGGREHFLILSRFEDSNGMWGHGCRLYQFGAPAPIDGDLLTGWMTRPPTGADDLPGYGSQRLWEPGWRMGMTVKAMHVPEDSRYRAQAGFSGNVLIAEAIGGF